MRHAFARTIWAMIYSQISILTPISVLMQIRKKQRMNYKQSEHLKNIRFGRIWYIWFNLSDKYLTATLKPHNSKDVIPFFVIDGQEKYFSAF